jgi:hypothetical protein
MQTGLRSMSRLYSDLRSKLVTMKRHLDLAGKSLAGAGLSGIVLYVVGTATQRSWPFWPYWIFIGMLVGGGVLYFLGQSRPRLDATITEDQDSQPAPAFTDLWRHTSNGAEAPGLMMITHKGFSHPGYMMQPPEKPPAVRIGMLVACDPLGVTPTTSDLRDNFLAFLCRSPITELIQGLTYVGDELSWRSYASNGRINNEAVLTASDEQADAPVVSALMILNEAGLPLYGHDSRVAELVLHVEPRDKDGQPAPAADFKAWHESFVRALAVPGVFAQFLSQDVGIATYDDPPAQLGVQLSAYRSVTQLVDPGGLRTVAGSQPSNWFLGYMIAERDGKGAADVAVDLLTRVCDHALHVHGYEAELYGSRTSLSDHG